MNVTLVMAVSINGCITGPNDDTEWVKDFELFYKTVADFGIAVMGKRTYAESVKYNVFPYKGALNIVMTHDAKLLKTRQEHVLFTDVSPIEVLEIAQKNGFQRVLVIGGGQLNASFLDAHLIDEIILDVHPLILSTGIHLFEGKFPNVQLELHGYQKINDDILQITYHVKK